MRKPERARGRLASFLTTLAVLLLVAFAARAEEPVTELNRAESVERPWARDVTPERQKAAERLFLDGNRLLKDSLFVQAVDKYRAALSNWDHPGIHYNLALALLNLDQPLAIHEHLQASLRYGAAPLDGEKFDHAKKYLALVMQQLAKVEVVCDEPGATVALNGKTILRSPGRYESLARPGEHTVTAERPGFVTTRQTKTLLPGKPTTFQVKLYKPEELIEYRRPWPMWGPVMLTGAGALILATGAVLTVNARDRFRDFDEQVATRQSCAAGCVPDSELERSKNQGETFQTLAVVSYAVGGAAVAGGIVLMVLNRSVPHRIEPGERVTAFSVAPSFGPGHASMLASGRF
jgi:hypothetical protein